jgi:outer membrane protein OmpA-like peptidoglycan-associated protein
MKKIILILAILLVSIYSYGQEKDFTKWAVDVELGNSTINDEASTSNETYDFISHLGAGVRYNFNPKFGLGLRGGYDNLNIKNDHSGNKVKFKFSRVHLDMNLNVFKMLDLHSNWFTLQVHGGPGVGFINTDNDYKETVAIASGGITGLFRVGNRSAVRLDFSTTANIAQNKSLDGSNITSNDGISSTIHNISVGYVHYFGKGKKKRHADWYEPKELVQKDTTLVINNLYNTYPITEIDETQIIDIVNNYYGNRSISEYVFFDHDKYVIRDTELNAIYKVYTELVKYDLYSLVIKGYASPTSSSDEYNKKLSENRSNVLYQKYIDMGIDSTRISFDSYGKDLKKSKENVHDVARRVELIVVKKTVK